MPRRILQGKVIKNAMNKTINVEVARLVKHPLYGKFIRTCKKYLAHDETNEFNVGDVVKIEECRPISKTKKWKVLGKVGVPKSSSESKLS